jgi:queuine tRNA-ribosyltransferase
MIKFTILKKSKKSRARLGLLETPHGIVETPTLVPVATQAVVKTLTSEEVLQTKSQILISNTFHLHLKPGEKYLKAADGIHKFMNWPKPIMTDSAGFQVFSLGFGLDYGTGKILKEKLDAKITHGQQPLSIKITEEGVYFRSPLDGRKLFIGPKESIKIQEAIGADIIVAFDECTSPIADYEYTKKSLERTHRWAKICLEEVNRSGLPAGRQALFGIVQGGKFKDLRIESARTINTLPFDGFGIGGEFGSDKATMTKMIRWVTQELAEEKPRHLLGIGHPDDMLPIIQSGVDTFDCTIPTHYARHGVAFTSRGKLDLHKMKFLKDKKSLDPSCGCSVCETHTRSYIAHLLRAKEITALRLLSFHNLYFFNTLVEKIRADIKNGRV